MGAAGEAPLLQVDAPWIVALKLADGRPEAVLVCDVDLGDRI